MMSEHIKSVTESDFEYEVLAYSQNTPVIVDFWAEWCKPCKMLSPILEKLVGEAGGSFRLAKVDADVNPNLVLKYSVRSIPTVLAFSQGSRISDFAGLQPEPRVREFINQILPPSPASLLVQKGDSLLAMGDLEGSREAYDEALKITEGTPGALLGLIKINLLEGNAPAARASLRVFPACKEYNKAERLLPLMKAMQDAVSGTLYKETDLDLAFENSMRLALRGNMLASVDGMMDILRADKHFRRERGKEVVLAILDLLDQESELTRQYRKELTNILF
ncbi:MAG: tetratricopeptide repeat protein [Anaerolineae bacterium]|nr:tetratricopeptide repeat protein [Anaerolineae bacterium]